MWAIGNIHITSVMHPYMCLTDVSHPAQVGIHATYTACSWRLTYEDEGTCQQTAALQGLLPPLGKAAHFAVFFGSLM